MSPPTAESSSINYQKKRRTSHGIAVWRQCTADDSQNRGLLRAVPAGLHLAFPFSPALRSSLFALVFLVASGEQSIVAFSLLASLVFPTAKH